MMRVELKLLSHHHNIGATGMPMQPRLWCADLRLCVWPRPSPLKQTALYESHATHPGFFAHAAIEPVCTQY